MQDPDIISALRPVIDAFNKLSIPYYIGGSIASSLYGVARTTIDVDMVADLGSDKILPLKTILQGSYYIDEDMITDAIHRKASFNLIHFESMIKIDVFIYRNEPYQIEEKNRVRKDTLVKGEKETEYFFSSPEDIIINKLLWFQMGNEVSSRQWSDALGVIKVQKDWLDRKYLIRWAEKLKIRDLLDRIFKESGTELS